MIQDNEKYGADFANAIKAFASGELEVLSKTQYSPTKTLFWEEKRFNPSLNYTHISHEFDAHNIEQNKYWKKSGSKFTGEPRFPPYVKKAGDGVLESGYLFPAEIANFNEREVVYFEKSTTPKKAIRMKPKVSGSKPSLSVRELISIFFFLRFTNNFFSIFQESINHPGPGSYKIPDPWAKSLEPVCGFIRPTSSFSTAYRDDVVRTNTTSYLERACTPVAQERFYKEDAFAESSSRSARTARVTKKKERLDVAGGNSPQKLTHPTSVWGGTSDRHLIDLKNNMRKHTRVPGFSFSSQLPSGTDDDFGLKYRRVKNPRGYPLIVPVTLTSLLFVHLNLNSSDGLV